MMLITRADKMDRGATQREPFSRDKDDRLKPLMNASKDLDTVLNAIEANEFRGRAMAELLVRRMREKLTINDDARNVLLFGYLDFKGSDLYVYYQAQKADLTKIIEHVAEHGVDELDVAIQNDDDSAMQLFTLLVVNFTSVFEGNVQEAFKEAFEHLKGLRASDLFQQKVKDAFQ